MLALQLYHTLLGIQDHNHLRGHLQIIEEEKDFQLSLSWRTLDENKKQADLCLGCSTIKLSKKVTELIQNINSTN